jgi:cyanate lyase
MAAGGPPPRLARPDGSHRPLIYRFYEIVQVYGTSRHSKEEEFGDGIMSAIDFTMDIRRESDPKGDRVIVTLNGKFLPYKKY